MREREARAFFILGFPLGKKKGIIITDEGRVTDELKTISKKGPGMSYCVSTKLGNTYDIKFEISRRYAPRVLLRFMVPVSPAQGVDGGYLREG